jgi:DNA helicase-2/ATP-dependent DNA helicase PcrA
MAMNHADDLEEERRVFHVAVTRACDEVYLVVPQVYRNRGGSLIMMKPSRFLTEIARDLTEPMELEESLPHLLGGVKRDLLPAPEET